MASIPPDSIPHINPPIDSSPTPPDKPSTTSGSGFFSSKPPTRGNSQSQGDNHTPIQISRSSTYLRTPPISEPSRQDKGYFSLQSLRSAARNARTTPPQSLTTPPYTSLGRSSGGSFHSSDTGHTGCSYSSSGLLSPPQFQGDDDNPPYRPRSGSTGSLSMMRTLRRAQTIPNDRKIKIKRRRRGRHGCPHKKFKGDEGHHLTCWGQSTCQVAPTAPAGQRVLCHGHAGHFVPGSSQEGNTDTYGRLLRHTMPGPAPPVITRRWSSVEIGVHQNNVKPSQENGVPPAPTAQRSTFLQSKIFRASTTQLSTRSDHEDRVYTRTPNIVQAVRDRLTFRRVSPDLSEPLVEPPLSITLRRASGASGVSQNPMYQKLSSARDSWGTTPLPSVHDHSHQGQAPTAYLITSEDIDSITELIAANFRQRHHSRNRSQTSSQSSRTTRSPSNFSKGIAELNLPSTESAMSSTEARQFNAPFRTHSQIDYLQVVPTGHRSLRRSESKRSVHELLWSGGGSAGSSGSGTSEEGTKPAILCDTSSDPATSPEIPPVPKSKKLPKRDKGDAFDPDNARASISEWSWRLPQNDIPTIITSSDSESNDMKPKTTTLAKNQTSLPQRSATSSPKEGIPRVRPFPRYAASHEKLQDVVSFPPLSTRKATNEWFSPLPEIEMTSPLITPPLTTSRSLYDLGVDVTIGPSSLTTPKAPFTSWVRSSEASPVQSPGIEFRQDYGFGRMSTSSLADRESRRRSIVKPHPKASARTGHSSAMGSSIGNHSREKRRSSTPHIQRVRTIDNIHKGERDTPSSRWRPPSVCPPRVSPSQLSDSPAEYDDAKDKRVGDRVPEIVTRLQRSRSGITDRLSLIEARSPQIPKADRAGIYGTITGTLRRSIAIVCDDDTAHHACDDCANDSRQPSVDWIG